MSQQLPLPPSSAAKSLNSNPFFVSSQFLLSGSFLRKSSFKLLHTRPGQASLAVGSGWLDLESACEYSIGRVHCAE